MSEAVHSFDDLRKAVDMLAAEEDDEGHPYIDRNAQSEGQQFIGHLESLNLPVPQIFPNGGDCVVFTWKKPDAKVYACVGGGDVAALVYGSGGERESEGFASRPPAEAAKMLQSLVA